jgi:uncharacterized protein
MSPQVENHTFASLVVEHLVPMRKGFAFRIWHANLTRIARRFSGYIRTDLCPPVKGKAIRWYSITHFDSPEHLNCWMQSDEREQLIKNGHRIFESYQFKSFATGLEGWFSDKTGSEHFGLGPAAWKQNLAVVFALYPTVMLQSLLFDYFGIMVHWPLANSMLVNNLITSSLLTWLVMPLVTKVLGFWLQPAYQPSTLRTNAVGVVLVASVLGCFALIFNLIL